MLSIKICSTFIALLIVFSYGHAGSKKQHGRELKEIKSFREDQALFKKFDAEISFDTVQFDTVQRVEDDLDFEQTTQDCQKALKALHLIDAAFAKTEKRTQSQKKIDVKEQSYFGSQDIIDIVVGQNKMRDRLEEKRFGKITYQECSRLIKNLSKEKCEALTSDAKFQELANELSRMSPRDNYKKISNKLRHYFKNIHQKTDVIAQQEVRALRLLLHQDLLAELVNRMCKVNIEASNIKKLKCALICSYSPSLFQNYKKFLEALYNNDYPTILSLLKKGILINWFISEQGFSALSYSINNPKGIGLLLIKSLLSCPGLDINMKTTKENTAFSFAVDKNYCDIVKLLLEEVDYQDDELGEFQELLVIDVNEPNKYGKTPLIVATEKNYTELAKILLDHGADKNLKLKSGLIAYDYAQKNQNLELMDLLRPES